MEYHTLFELFREEKRSPNLTQVQEDIFPTAQKINHEAARKVSKMIYDLRVRKVVNLALNKSRAPESLANTQNMTTSEMGLFHDLYTKLSNHENDIL